MGTTRRERVEMAIAEAFSSGFVPWKLLFALDAMDSVTPKRLRPRCGARCRDGHPCQARVVWDTDNDRPRNGRCRMHGGLSTGPKTQKGRARIAKANRRRAKARRGVDKLPS